MRRPGRPSDPDFPAGSGRTSAVPKAWEFDKAASDILSSILALPTVLHKGPIVQVKQVKGERRAAYVSHSGAASANTIPVVDGKESPLAV